MALWSDDEVLQVMWRFEAKHDSAAQIALAFGTSRSAVLGVVKRVKDSIFQLDGAGLGDNDRLVILRRVLGGADAARVAKDFARRCPGLTRYAVLLLVSQILRETALAGDDLCVKPANRDAVGWPSWWSTTVVRRGRVA